jgi:2-amino-4-hydroxy-6-hydroxymethyldihydropteridine diphosphokinase
VVTDVAIALGSNVGDRETHLDFALGRLRRVLEGVAASARHDTEPVGVGPQPMFLNQAAVGRTALTARALLDELLAIERERGRARPYAGAPRTLDLDLVLFGELIVSERGLEVPHPRFRERLFVLAPLAEIAPAMRDPVTGLTVAELRDRLASRGARPAMPGP